MFTNLKSINLKNAEFSTYQTRTDQLLTKWLTSMNFSWTAIHCGYPWWYIFLPRHRRYTSTYFGLLFTVSLCCKWPHLRRNTQPCITKLACTYLGMGWDLMYNKSKITFKCGSGLWLHTQEYLTFRVLEALYSGYKTAI